MLTFLNKIWLLGGVLIVLSCAPEPDKKKIKSPEPLLYFNDLIQAPDFRKDISQAVANDDVESILNLQKTLLELANAANLPQTDINRLKGQQGLVFLRFQGKVINYDREFMRRYTQFEPIEPLFETYSDLTSLHEYSMKLVQERNRAIKVIKQELLMQSFSESEANEKARARWQAFVSEARLVTALQM